MKRPPPPVMLLAFCHSLSTKQSRFSFPKPRKWDPSSEKPAWNRISLKKKSDSPSWSMVLSRKDRTTVVLELFPERKAKKLKLSTVVFFSCQDSGLGIQIVRTWTQDVFSPCPFPTDFCKPWRKESRGVGVCVWCLSPLLMLFCVVQLLQYSLHC